MRRRSFAAALVLAILATPVWAEDKPKPDVDQTVKLSAMALPIVSDQKVINYIFVEVRLLLTPSADATALRDKEPFFRDALVRAAYRTPFGVANDPNRVDIARLKAVMLREAAAIAGPNMIRAIAVDSQTPQHRLALSRPAPPAPPAPASPSP
jgi:hypothetical protein